MSNSTLPSTSFQLKEKKDKYLELIANGEVESTALGIAGITKAQYIRTLLDDTDFAKQVEMARKHRAEFWVSKIAEDATQYYEPKDVGNARLVFDKLSYLAKADNPERYGGSGKGTNININLGEFKMLPPEEARKILANDPFALEAEYTQIPINDEDLL